MNQDALARVSVGELEMSCKPARQKRIHRSPEDDIRQYRVSEGSVCGAITEVRVQESASYLSSLRYSGRL